jgi:hypothetical protein
MSYNKEETYTFNDFNLIIREISISQPLAYFTILPYGISNHM